MYIKVIRKLMFYENYHRSFGSQNIHSSIKVRDTWAELDTEMNEEIYHQTNESKIRNKTRIQKLNVKL